MKFTESVWNRIGEVDLVVLLLEVVFERELVVLLSSSMDVAILSVVAVVW